MSSCTLVGLDAAALTTLLLARPGCGKNPGNCIDVDWRTGGCCAIDRQTGGEVLKLLLRHIRQCMVPWRSRHVFLLLHIPASSMKEELRLLRMVTSKLMWLRGLDDLR